MILWAIVSTCTAAAKNLGSLIAVRFILGLCEGPFFPGAAFWLTCWCKPSDRTCKWSAQQPVLMYQIPKPRSVADMRCMSAVSAYRARSEV